MSPVTVLVMSVSEPSWLVTKSLIATNSSGFTTVTTRPSTANPAMSTGTIDNTEK